MATWHEGIAGGVPVANILIYNNFLSRYLKIEASNGKNYHNLATLTMSKKAVLF